MSLEGLRNLAVSKEFQDDLKIALSAEREHIAQTAQLVSQSVEEGLAMSDLRKLAQQLRVPSDTLTTIVSPALAIAREIFEEGIGVKDVTEALISVGATSESEEERQLLTLYLEALLGPVTALVTSRLGIDVRLPKFARIRTRPIVASRFTREFDVTGDVESYEPKLAGQQVLTIVQVELVDLKGDRERVSFTVDREDLQSIIKWLEFSAKQAIAVDQTSFKG